MANITISNLKPNGYELFSDSESYMMDLCESELNATNGGAAISPAVTAVPWDAIATLLQPVVTEVVGAFS